MTNLLLISKNPALAELISSEQQYNLEWFNNDLSTSPDLDEVGVVVYDSFSYGIKPVESELFAEKPLIILDAYNESLFIASLVDQKQRAYLLVDDFLEELPEAIDHVVNGQSFVTKYLSDTVV